jgi:hypothetical protein
VLLELLVGDMDDEELSFLGCHADAPTIRISDYEKSHIR